jgi:hypothetical protein
MSTFVVTGSANGSRQPNPIPAPVDLFAGFLHSTRTLVDPAALLDDFPRSDVAFVAGDAQIFEMVT